MSKPLIKLAGSVLSVTRRSIRNEHGQNYTISLDVPEMFAEHAAKVMVMKGPVNIIIQEQE